MSITSEQEKPWNAGLKKLIFGTRTRNFTHKKISVQFWPKVTTTFYSNLACVMRLCDKKCFVPHKKLLSFLPVNGKTTEKTFTQ